jgi:cytochrome P450
MAVATPPHRTTAHPLAAVPLARGRRAPGVPLRRTLSSLVRDPIGAFEQIGARADGRIVRPNLGLVRPYLVTDPEHVQYVLRDRADAYRRDGMMWNSIRRLLGNGIITDGATWEPRRANMVPLFSGKNIAALIDDMAAGVNDTVDQLTAGPAESPRKSGSSGTAHPVDMGALMTRIADRAFSRTLFGARMTPAESATFTGAVETAFRAVAARILLPFVPNAVPMPGDRAFRRAIRDVDGIMLPLIAAARQDPTDRHDILSTLIAARDDNGRALTDREVRDDAVSMFAAGFETSAVALTWLWVVLAEHPEVAARLQREVDEVVGDDRPGPAHLSGLRYTKMVIQEVLRQYSPGWIIPRVASRTDVIDGVRISSGATVLISPYLTHRLPSAWPDPRRFDPERFSPEQIQGRHRFAYLPFGGGPHGCIGNHFFIVEAQLAVAAVLSRFRPTRHGSGPVRPAIGASLRPGRRILMTLTPRPTGA